MYDLTPAIEFRVDGFTPNANAYNFVSQVIQPAMAQMDLTCQDVQKIIIADNGHYGPAIAELSAMDGYTDDGIYQGIGKTLPRFENGMYAGSNLLIHHCVIGSFVASDQEVPAGEAEAMRYAIYHEFGHCADYRRRLSQHGKKPRQGIESFVLRCAEANSRVALSEYAACFFSAQFMTPAGFAYSAGSVVQNSADYIALLSQECDKYRSGLLPLTTLRDSAMATFWRIIVEHTKLWAYLHRNPLLAPQGEVSFASAGNHNCREQIIRSMSGALREAWGFYPDCFERFENLITTLFFKITETEGYGFEVRPDGDYLWLR